MDVHQIAGQLLLDARFDRKAANDRPAAVDLTNVATQFASSRAGIFRSELPSEYELVFANTARLETREVERTRPVFEQRPIEELRPVLAWRDIVEEQEIYETRDIVETRPIFEERAIMEARVEATKSLSGMSRPSDAGILSGASMTVEVEGSGTASITFGTNRVTVDQDGVTTEFRFQPNNGSFKSALVEALDSLDGLQASYTEDERLALATSDGRSLSLGDGLVGLLSPLGLQAGTTQASEVGTEQVEIGSQDVVVGTEQVLVGTQQVVIGSEQYVAGHEMVVIGTEQVQVGLESYFETETVEVHGEGAAEGLHGEIVGLERSRFYGVAQLLSGLPASGLTLEQIDMLFGMVADEVPSEPEDTVRIAYREADDEG
jgi:hypothetical protein